MTSWARKPWHSEVQYFVWVFCRDRGGYTGGGAHLPLCSWPPCEPAALRAVHGLSVCLTDSLAVYPWEACTACVLNTAVDETVRQHSASVRWVQGAAAPREGACMTTPQREPCSLLRGRGGEACSRPLSRENVLTFVSPRVVGWLFLLLALGKGQRAETYGHDGQEPADLACRESMGLTSQHLCTKRPKNIPKWIKPST